MTICEHIRERQVQAELRNIQRRKKRGRSRPGDQARLDELRAITRRHGIKEAA